MREALMCVAPTQADAELVAFLRASPLVGEAIVIERDRSTGQVADFEVQYKRFHGDECSDPRSIALD